MGLPPPPSFLFTPKQLEESPSRRDGVDAEAETRMRRNYGDLLQKAGEGLQIPQPTIATAVLFCHRYFVVKSMKRNDRFVVATACLLLACKVEECQRRVQRVLEMCYSVRYRMDLNDVKTAFQDNSKVYQMLKENVLVAERALLYTLGFNFRIEKPYQHITERALKFEGMPQNAIRFLTQIAWNFVNDSLQTTLLLQYQPKHVAYSALYLAAKFLRIDLPNEEGRPWYEKDAVPVHAIKDITRKMLEYCEACAETAFERKIAQEAAAAPSGAVPASPSVGQKRDAGGVGVVGEEQRQGHGTMVAKQDGRKIARSNSTPDVDMEIEAQG